MQYLSKFELVPVFQTEDEVEYWFTPREGIIACYVVEVKISLFLSVTHTVDKLLPNIKTSLSISKLSHTHTYVHILTHMLTGPGIP